MSSIKKKKKKQWKDLSFVRAEKKDKQVCQSIERRKYGTHEMGDLEQPALTEIWKHTHSHVNKAQGSLPWE